MIIGVTSPTFSNNKDLVKILKKKNVKKIILSKKNYLKNNLQFYYQNVIEQL